MKDYYAILGVRSDAGKPEIRKAYRGLAKTLHPDVAENDARADNRFILLKEAYEILINPETRAQYDVSRKTRISPDEFNYREFLKNRSNDQRSMAELICYDLLHDKENEALELYDNLVQSGIFDFQMHVDREAFMDYSFLLAEEYLQQGCYIKAYQIFFNISLLEEDKAYFKHFYQDVLKHLFDICRKPVPDDNEELVRLRFLHDISGLDYPEKDRARIYKMISEIYSSRRDLESARKYLLLAWDTWKGLPGLSEAVEAMNHYYREKKQEQF